MPDKGRFEIKKSQEDISIVFSSSMGNVDRACDEICGTLKRRIQGITKHLFSIQLVLREGLTNAVRHGNNHDIDKQVICNVRIEKEQVILVEIEDQGEGFDWRSAQVVEVGDDEDHGRGLMIMEQYFSRYWYNETGNKLMLEKRVE